jgi:hypothetical protein
MNTDLTTAPNATYAQAFAQTLRLVAQQMQSQLENAVTRVPDFKGISTTVDYAGKREMHKVQNRKGPTPVYDQQYIRRYLDLNLYEDGDQIPWEDFIAQVYDPQGSIIQSMVAGANRAKDAEIVVAFDGLSRTVAAGDAANPGYIALPTAQIIAPATTGLSFAKLNKALQLLNSAYHGPENGGDLHLVLSSWQVADLLADPNITSLQYNTVGAIQDGSLGSGKLMGFTVHKYEGLPTYTFGTSGQAMKVFAWDARAVAWGVAQEPTIDAQVDPGRKYDVIPYLRTGFGAVRTTEDGVVRIDCQTVADA